MTNDRRSFDCHLRHLSFGHFDYLFLLVVPILALFTNKIKLIKLNYYILHNKIILKIAHNLIISWTIRTMISSNKIS